MAGGLMLAALPWLAAHGAKVEGVAVMGDWMPIGQWSRCADLARPGVVFEVRNSDGQSMLTDCSETPPAAVWDWTSPPAEFRAVPEEPPQHSAPTPAPAG